MGCEGNCGPGGKYWQPTVGFMTHVTCRLTAKYRDHLRNPTLGNRVWATFTFLYYTVHFTAGRTAGRTTGCTTSRTSVNALPDMTPTRNTVVLRVRKVLTYDVKHAVNLSGSFNALICIR